MTHPSYPERFLDIDDEQYDEKCPFFEAKHVTDNEGIWADFLDISTDELKERKVWRKNKLVCLKDTDILFKDGKPRTPIYTGLKGRGLLGRYGPNHASDPIITRYNKEKNDYEFIGVLRADVDEWAIPGGMVDPGEQAPETLKREFCEEVTGNVQSHLTDQIFKMEKFYMLDLLMGIQEQLMIHGLKHMLFIFIFQIN